MKKIYEEKDYTEQLRTEFEAWITAPPYERPVNLNPDSSAFPGQYRVYEVQLAWEAYQEGRASTSTSTDECRWRLQSQYETQLQELAELRKDAERYRYIRKGNQWIVAATHTGFHLDGGELDGLIDTEMEETE